MTKSDQTIEELKSMLEIYSDRLGFIKQNKEFLDEHDLTVSFGWETVDFDSLTHEQSIKVIKNFGGKWEKTYRDDVIDYEAKIKNQKIRIYGGEPPANCKLVEYEETVPERIIPAQVIKKFRLQCKETVTASELVEETPNAS